MVDGLVVMESRFLAYPSIGVRAPEERVLAALGEPTRRTSDTLECDCGMHVEEPGDLPVPRRRPPADRDRLLSGPGWSSAAVTP